MTAKKKARKIAKTKTPAKKVRPLAALKHLPVIGTYIERENAVVGAYMNSVDGKDVDAVLLPCDGNRKPIILDSRGYGCFGDDLKGAVSMTDDAANTKAMAKAGSALAKEIIKLDGALPAKHTLMAIYANLKHLFGSGWFWSSSQFDARYAWVQGFDYGNVNTWYKYTSIKAFPVRRVNASTL